MSYTPVIRSLTELRQAIDHYTQPDTKTVSLAVIASIGPRVGAVKRDLKNPQVALAHKLADLGFDTKTILTNSTLPIGAIPIFLLHYSQAGHRRAEKVAGLAGVWKMLSMLANQ